MDPEINEIIANFFGVLPLEVDDYEIPDSTAVATMGYDNDTQELYVRYTTGGEYIYHQVSRQRWVAFKNATSQGVYINKKIKPNYVYTRGW